jgi:hypothetical protein
LVDRRLIGGAVAVVAFAVGWYVRGLAFPPARRSYEVHHALVANKPMQKAFEDIYNAGYWGSNTDPSRGLGGTSGTGSTLDATVYWRTFLTAFMKANHITSVVDAGCGDWVFSHTIDWTGIDYKGYDIVDSVIQADRKSYEAPNIHFFAANMIETDLPPADLLISKHVLQHLPNDAVAKFTAQFSKYRHVLIVNGVDPITLSSDNPDITPGNYRELDITAPPFDVPGERVLTYWDGDYMHQVVHVSGHP